MLGMLAKGLYSPQPLSSGCQLPVFEKLRPVLCRPLDREPERPRWKSPVQDLETCDRNLDLVLAIDSMEMWWVVILEVHPNRDPEEARDLRHRATVRTASCLGLTDLTAGGPLADDGFAGLTARPARPERPVNALRLRLLARRHAAGHPPRPCSHDDPATPCDAALLVTEITRLRAWADFASGLLDAHMYGFAAGDWQAAEGLAIARYSSDWPPDWKRNRGSPARIIVDPSLWPTPGVTGPGDDAESATPS